MKTLPTPEKILEKAYIQEWFNGSDSFDGMIDCIIDAYPLKDLGCSKDELIEWVKDEIEAYNDDASDQDKLVW